MHKNLLGIEWQKELYAIDTLLMPYGAERYRYQPSAMLFTAIGYYKPVLVSPEINPEVLAKYKIGQSVTLSSEEEFTKQLEVFVEDLLSNKETYQTNLLAANKEYSQENLLKDILNCS